MGKKKKVTKKDENGNNCPGVPTLSQPRTVIHGLMTAALAGLNPPVIHLVKTVIQNRRRLAKGESGISRKREAKTH